MPITPHRIAQTTSEAKKAHKKNGSRIPERQMRQLEREAELEQRAARIREAEERKKAAKKKRQQKEMKEREERRQMGVGLATQLIGYSRTQAQLKSGMESFLGLRKKKEDEKQKNEAEFSKKLEEIIDEAEKEPWDDDGRGADKMMSGLQDLDKQSREQWVDDDLDDETLLKAHDLFISDPVQEAVNLQPKPKPCPAPTPAPAPLAVEVEKSVVLKGDVDFVRLHGPINKAIEDILDKLPEPPIELLSRDATIDPSLWNPADALLHKLNPVGVPPHRLRIKVGCVVMLLRDLNTSSQLSKSQNLRILRVESERLECLVLDGQLAGTKTFLTRVPFPAKYRGDPQCLFMRTQFPIRVTQDTFSSSTNVPQNRLSTAFKLPLTSSHVRRSTSMPRKPPLSTLKTKTQSNPNPSFKLPGLPASKLCASKQSGPTAPSLSSLSDDWDEFLASGTQLARELSPEELLESTSALDIDQEKVASLPLVSTQDLDVLFDEMVSTQELDTMLDEAQAERESCFPSHLSRTAKLSSNRSKPQGSIRDLLPPLSTQDFDFSLVDLDDFEEMQPKQSSKENIDSPTKPEASATELFQLPNAVPRVVNQHLAKARPMPSLSPDGFNFGLEDSDLLDAQQKLTEQAGCTLAAEKKAAIPTAANLQSKPFAPSNAKSPAKPTKQHPPTTPKSLAIVRPAWTPTKAALQAQPRTKPIQQPHRPNLKRPAPPISVNNPLPPAKRISVPHYHKPTPKVHISIPKLISFSDFGLSTQDAASLFDDDDDINLDSPPNLVTV